MQHPLKTEGHHTKVGDNLMSTLTPGLALGAAPGSVSVRSHPQHGASSLIHKLPLVRYRLGSFLSACLLELASGVGIILRPGDPVVEEGGLQQLIAFLLEAQHPCVTCLR